MFCGTIVIRINTADPSELQFVGTSMGNAWNHRCRSDVIGKFLEVSVILRELYVFGEKGIFISKDGGRSWNKIVRNKNHFRTL